MVDVTEHGLEVIKKAAVDLLTGGQPKRNYALQVYLTNPEDIAGGGSAANLETRNAGEVLSALKCVYAFDANTVKSASSSDTIAEAMVIGVAITAAGLNESMQFQTHGTLRDTSFTFAANEPLYVSPTGTLTNVPPITGYQTQVGTSQGAGSIFINIQDTITL